MGYETPEFDVEQAIRRYRETSREGKLGFVVPDTVGLLLEVGMPYREASILVARAPRAFYPDVPFSAIEQLAQPSLRLDITRALGRGLELRYDGRLMLPMKGRRRRAELMEIFIMGPAQRKALVLNAAQIEQGFQAYRQQVKLERGSYQAYNKTEDDPAFLSALYEGLANSIRATAAEWKTPDLALSLLFVLDEKQFARLVPVREHSKSGQRDVQDARLGYKNLKNVNLSDLPRLLVSLARRTKRKGRRLPLISTSHLSLENPMSHHDDDAYWGRQYQQGPYGARESVPVARRNTGKRKARKNSGKRRSSSQAGAAMSIAQDLMARGMARGPALTQGWAIVKGEARSNPWYPGTPSLYLPDTTQTMSALVPAPYDDYQDLTQRHSALVPGPYARPNGYKRGQFSVTEARTGGFQPINRRNPGQSPAQRQAQQRAKVAMELYHSGQASSLKEAWRMVDMGKGRKR
jgi:hypothetical protein